MTEMQQRILMLLTEVDQICQQYHIEYYLEGGAVLGAIRHGGFLPWDDDSDLAMTRENWEKFKKAFSELQPENRALEGPELNDKYPTNTVRYMDTTTTNIWRSLMYDVCACGVAVDIFILEDAPDDDEKLEQMQRDLIDYSEFINPYYRLSSLGDGKRYKHYRRMSMLLGERKVSAMLDERIKQYYNSPCKRYLMRWGMRFQVYNKEIFGKPVYVPFENTMLPIPQKPYEYLIYQYGIDWNMIPEQSEVELHDTVRDLEVGYRTYMDDYMPQIDRKKAFRQNLQYKIAEMEALDYNKKYHWHIYGTAGKAAAFLLNKKLASQQVNLSASFANVTPEADALFHELFDDYLFKQLNQWFLFYNVFVPIDDEVLGIVISYLLRIGCGREAEKLIDVRRQQKKEPSPLLQKAFRSYEILAESSCRFWAGEIKNAAEVIRGEQDIVITPEEQAFCLFYDLISGTNVQTLRKETEALMKVFPQEDLLKLLYIRILLEESQPEQAKTMAKQLLESSSNGMVIRILQTDEEYRDTVQIKQKEEQ